MYVLIGMKVLIAKCQSLQNCGFTFSSFVAVSLHDLHAFCPLVMCDYFYT